MNVGFLLNGDLIRYSVKILGGGHTGLLRKNPVETADTAKTRFNGCFCDGFFLCVQQIAGVCDTMLRQQLGKCNAELPMDLLADIVVTVTGAIRESFQSDIFTEILLKVLHKPLDKAAVSVVLIDPTVAVEKQMASTIEQRLRGKN